MPPTIPCPKGDTSRTEYGTLIVPCWLSAPFWPIVFPDGLKPAAFVRGYRVINEEQWPIVPGRLGHAFPICNLLAIQFHFASE